MRIEVMVGSSDEPMIYSLEKPKLTVGSAETSDIVIVSTGVSRKHLSILTENDEYFVIDQGSTNGTFINEERLVPGRKVEFTSFFPVRLGDNVLITLLSDEEDSALGRISFPTPKEKTSPGMTIPKDDQNSTRIISLKDLNKAKTTDLVKKREQVLKKNAKKAAPARVQDKEKTRMTIVKFLVVGMIAGAAYVNFSMLEEEAPMPVAQMGQVVNTTTPKASEAPPKAQNKLIDDKDLIPSTKFSQLLIDLKCITDAEKYVCDALPDMVEDKRWGAVQVGTMMIVLINGQKYFEEAKTLISPPAVEASVETRQLYKKHILEVASLLFMVRGMPKDFNYEALKDRRLTVIFFQKTETGDYSPEGALAVFPEVLKEIKSSVSEGHISSIRRLGPAAYTFVKDLFKVY